MGPGEARHAPRIRGAALRRFERFVVIDWSGQAVAHPKGLAVACATPGDVAPVLLRPVGGWSREGLLDWLLAQADQRSDMLIGIDLSPALPFNDAGAYLPGWPGSPEDARALWALVDDLCASDPHLSAHGVVGHPDLARYFRRPGAQGDRFGAAGRGRLRVCEARQLASGLSPSSCLNLVGAAQVGKSSLTGMRVLHRLGGRIPVWPFDPVPPGGPVIVEIYTTIAARAAGIGRGRSKVRSPAALRAALEQLGSAGDARLVTWDEHSTDAVLSAAWLRREAGRAEWWRPEAMTAEIARTEGWTFGVP